MDKEPTTATVVEEPTTPEPEAPEAAEPTSEPAAPQTLDMSFLDTIDPDELSKHPRFAGILGQRLQREQQRWEQQRQEKAEREARASAETELLKLAEEDPYEFSKRYLTDAEQKRMQRDLASLRGETQREYVQRIGKAVAEKYVLSPADVQEIAAELAGKTDDEVLPVFTLAAAKIAAKREATQMHSEWREKELAKEKEAWKLEYEAERLAESTGPDLRKPNGQGAPFNPAALSDEEFNKWYVSQGPGRGLGLTR